MKPEIYQHISAIVALVGGGVALLIDDNVVKIIGGAIGLLAGYAVYHYGKKVNVKKFMEDKSINLKKVNVTDNSGNTQVNIGSPGSQQVINERRVIQPQYEFSKESRDGNFFIVLQLNQTAGIWDAGTKFKLGLKLSGSYTNYKFLQGFPGAMQNIRTTINKDDGLLVYETATPPNNEPIVLEIESEQDISIEQVAVEPTIQSNS